MANAELEQEQFEPRQRLLPSLGKLCGIHAIALLLSYVPAGIWVGMVAILVYIAIIVLVTIELVNSPQSLHPIDARLLRYSGPLALASLILYTSVLFVLVSYLPDDWAEAQSILLFMQLIGEVGFVFSIACVFLNDSTRHVVPLVLWRIICLPLLLLFLFMVFLPTMSIVTRNFD